MTAPNGSGEYGYVVGPGNGFGRGYDEETARALSRGKVKGFEKGQEGIQLIASDLAATADSLRDSQLDMVDRLDLLEGVEGYCSAFLDKNWNVRGGAWRTLPFVAQLGPAKNARLDRDGIRFLTKGLWRADCHITYYPRPSGWGAQTVGSAVKLRVNRTSDGSMFTEAQYDAVIGVYGAETASFSHTFVVPEDNAYRVVAEVQHTRDYHMLYGGTLRSSLSVNKWDNGTDNALVMPTVPNGGTLQ